MSGSSTLCSAVARASRLKVWKTKPISLLRMRASSSSFNSLTRCPFSQYWPLLGVSRQPIKFMSVDLPEPEGPMMATYSPLRISRVTPRNACTCSEPISYVFHRSSVLMTMPASTKSCRNVCEEGVTCSTAIRFWLLTDRAHGRGVRHEPARYDAATATVPSLLLTYDAD